MHTTDIQASEEHLFDDLLAEHGFPPAAPLRSVLEVYAVWAALLLICFAVWCLIVWGVWVAVR